MPKRRKWPIIVGITIPLVLFFVLAGIAVYQILHARSILEEWDSEDFVYEIDEEVIQVIDAKSSTAIDTVAELSSGLKERGFGEIDIYAAYDLSGQLLEEELALDRNSNEKYPLYYIPYIDSNGNLWIIYSLNGIYQANPLFAHSDLSGEVILVENEYLIGYDGIQNTFIESIPAEHEVEIKRVERIDAATLSQLTTVEEIEAL